MSAEEELLRRFGARGLVDGGLLYLPPAAALDFVRECEAAGLAVTGVEGFEPMRDGVRALLDVNADFSTTRAGDWAGFRRRCNAAAVAFLSGLPPRPGLLVNLTTLTREEWEGWAAQGS